MEIILELIKKNKNVKIIGQEVEMMVKKIEIKELAPEEIEKLDVEIKTFAPIGCLNCDFKGGIKGRIFSVNTESENSLDEIQIEVLMKKKFNVTQFGVFAGGKGYYLTVAKCPRCSSEDIFWDY